jgi:hypothetical protein
MFESRHEPLISRRRFYRRMLKFVMAALVIDGLAVAVGATGYRAFGGLSWMDATLNAALVITGNGPIGGLQSEAGKLFTTLDALFGDITFIVVAAVLLSPVIHRMLHAVNVDPAPADDSGREP